MVLVCITAATFPGLGLVHAFEEPYEGTAADVVAGPQQQDAADRKPEANLPYLFAVFIITWAGFFTYAFIMSRRQREMQREIEGLKRVLAERDERKAGTTQG